jgi:rhamnogalacturonyl hydrolase YesR
MKRHLLVSALAILAVPLFSWTPGAFAQTTLPADAAAIANPNDLLQPRNVHDLMLKVMNYQVHAYGNKYSVAWQSGAFWAGVMAAHTVTGDEDFYDAAHTWGENAKWAVEKRHYHADDLAVGQSYIDMYLREQDSALIAPLKTALTPWLTATTITRNDVGGGPAGNGAPFIGRNVWWWCDALFMGPPLLARMSGATGDKRYLDLMHTLYWDSADYLLDKDDHLFFRDASNFYPAKKSPTGKKVFWSRGNGWVYAGLVRSIDFIPPDDPQRSKYIDLFKKMSAAIVSYQQPDGTWCSSLNEPTWIPGPESSGTSFFTFGLLAGINRNWLDQKTYLAPALKGWQGLCGLVGPDGGVKYSQGVGSAPGATKPETHMDYTQGAFLMAGSEVLRLGPPQGSGRSGAATQPAGR